MVKGPAGEYRLFDKSSRDLDTLPLLPGPNPQDLTTRPLAGSLYQERDSHLTRFLYGSSDGWLEIVPDNRDPNWRSYDENGYYLFYYYCADVSPYLTQFWLSVSAWAMINILPLIILTILHNVNNIRQVKGKMDLVLLFYPGRSVLLHIWLSPAWSPTSSTPARTPCPAPCRGSTCS